MNREHINFLLFAVVSSGNFSIVILRVEKLIRQQGERFQFEIWFQFEILVEE